MKPRPLLALFLLAAMLLGSLCPVAFATSEVQTCTAHTSGASTVSCTPSSNVTSGDVVVAACTSLNAPITSVTDIYGTYTVSGSSNFLSGNGYVMVAAIKATSTASDTITCNIGSGYSTSFTTISVIEVSGISVTGYTSSTGSGSGTALHTASSVSYSANAFLVAAYIQSNGSSWTHGSGFTILESFTGNFGGSQYGIFTSAGSSNFPMTLSGSETWGGIGVAYSSGSSTYDLFLYYPNSATSFPISSYPDSYVKLTYPDSPPSYIYNLSSSSLVLDTHGATLLTVWVASDYFVSIIPKDTTNGSSNYVYLQVPAQEFSYEMEVQDLTTHFGPGTKVVVSDGGRVRSSGYTDSQDNYPLWMVPGYYNVTLIDGANTFQTTLSFPAIQDSTLLIQTLKFSVTGNCGTSCTVATTAGFNGALTDLYVILNDTTGTTTSISYSIIKTNATGGYYLCSGSWASSSCPSSHTGTWGNFQSAVSCDSDACNSTLAGQMTVEVTFSDEYGSQTNFMPVAASGIFGPLPDIPSNAFGWDDIFGTISPVAGVAYVLILLSAAVSGGFFARFMGLVLGVETVAFVYAGWLPLNPNLVPLVLVEAVASFIAALELGR